MDLKNASDSAWCAWRPRVYDLAFAILLCCATHESPLQGEDIWSLSQPARIEPKLINTFLDACSRAGWPLNDPERKALRPQIILSWCSVRLAGISKVEPPRWMEFLARPPHDLTELIPATLG